MPWPPIYRERHRLLQVFEMRGVEGRPWPPLLGAGVPALGLRLRFFFDDCEFGVALSLFEDVRIAEREQCANLHLSPNLHVSSVV